jgi:hypothetical protein
MQKLTQTYITHCDRLVLRPLQRRAPQEKEQEAEVVQVEVEVSRPPVARLVAMLRLPANKLRSERLLPGAARLERLLPQRRR